MTDIIENNNGEEQDAHREDVQKPRGKKKASIAQELEQVTEKAGGRKKAPTTQKVTWKPGGNMGFLKVPEGFVPRWVSNDEANIQKKLSEGWVFVNGTKSASAKRVADRDYDNTKGGDGLGDTVKYREMIGMMLPVDLYEARKEYMREETKRMTEGRIQGGADGYDNRVKKSGNVKTTIRLND